MKEITKWALTFVVVFCGAALSGYSGYRKGYQDGYISGQQTFKLPTQSEIQEILGVPVDGVIGRESREAWDAASLKRVEDEYVIPYMEAFQREVDKVYGFDKKPLAIKD